MEQHPPKILVLFEYLWDENKLDCELWNGEERQDFLGAESGVKPDC